MFAFLILSFMAAPAIAQDLVIYTYDSFFSGEPRERLSRAITQRTGHTVKWVVAGDSAQVVSRHQLDLRSKKPKAHLLLGIDESTLGGVATDALPVDEKMVPELREIDPKLRVHAGFVPYHTGVMAFMVDREKLPEAQWPKRWDDLLKPELKKKLILEDPRTSTPGLGFLLTTQQIWKTGFSEKWKALRQQWLTLTPGWSQAYGLFQKGEAPLVWSYTTSQAYHQLASAPTDRYRALVFEEGNPLQVEGAVVPKSLPGGEAMKKAALAAMGVLLSEATQTEIPRAQWMSPVRKSVAIPWKNLSPPIPEPLKIIRYPVGTSTAETLKLWSNALR